jgi:FMN-dependent NADH-azoreductase
MTGLEPRIITVELTLADVNPALAEFKPQAAESHKHAIAAIDQLWVGADHTGTHASQA